jgi:putative Holliday junction resolvase
MRYLGVDPGGQRIGLALGDSRTGIASPHEVLPYGGIQAAAEMIHRQAERLGADCIVIGNPTAADGRPTPACRRSQALAEALQARGLEVVLQSELLTTNEARRRARDAGVPRGRPIDHIAAQVMLEEYLLGVSE